MISWLTQRTLMIMSSTFEKYFNVFKPTVCMLKCQSASFITLHFLGFIVSMDGIRMDPEKCQKVLDWPEPLNFKTLQGFLGFANFYRKFIKNNSKTIVNLTALL